MANYAVFDIGGTAIKCAVTDGGGCIREKERLVNPARTDGVGAMLARLIQRLRAYEAAYPLTGVGVATAGVVDAATGTISGDAMNIPDYRGSDNGGEKTAQRRRGGTQKHAKRRTGGQSGQRGIRYTVVGFAGARRGKRYVCRMFIRTGKISGHRAAMHPGEKTGALPPKRYSRRK